ncbi:hypothetical protein OESDEN_24811 [Oesophagostomum dentatum]|uniref:Uncharacterized protein n=1 Tax=Oesophagostomum dentatum TaxID=61180 RepID=A0A0B1RR68_OESDE|nr:hypothetical protein OESDEN_24811 [Oesophagostomum dentatum]
MTYHQVMLPRVCVLLLCGITKLPTVPRFRSILTTTSPKLIRSILDGGADEVHMAT